MSIAYGSLQEIARGYSIHAMQAVEEVRRANLLLLIDRHGGQVGLATAAGIGNPAQISQWKNRSPHAKTGKPRVMSSESARSIELALGLPANWMDTPQEAPPARIHAYDVRVVDGMDGIDSERDVMVDEIDVLLSGGPGNYVPEFVETKYRMPFQADWFRKHRVKPENVKLMRVNGHSMERTLFDGDRVAVNFADTRVRDGKVYALAIGGEAKIKRLFNLRDGGYRIVSDNTDKDVYPDEVVPGDEKDTVAVLGRAIDRSGSGGL